MAGWGGVGEGRSNTLAVVGGRVRRSGGGGGGDRLQRKRGGVGRGGGGGWGGYHGLLRWYGLPSSTMS